MEKILVSVIMPVYNNFKYYKESITSLLKQSYSNIEFIITDDNSNNFIKKEIVEFIEINKKENITSYSILENKKNVGTVKNFGGAIKKSKGEIIIPLAIDDVFYDDDVIERIVFQFQNSKSMDVLSTVAQYCNEQLIEINKTVPPVSEIEKINKMSPKEQFKFYSYRNFSYGAALYYRRGIFEKVGFFDEKYKFLEDWPFLLKCMRNGIKIDLINFKTIKYRDGGISNRPNSRYIDDLMVLFNEDILPYKKDIGLLRYRLVKYRMFNDWNRIDRGTSKWEFFKHKVKFIDSKIYLKWKLIKTNF